MVEAINNLKDKVVQKSDRQKKVRAQVLQQDREITDIRNGIQVVRVLLKLVGSLPNGCY